ncbi:MAG: hypothetical protein IKU00_01535 [Bacteroidales bacterium]|nr:hypothetical protein [Bacteroidales bacterium]
MKKLVLVLAIVFAGMMTANAQVWIGGGLGAQVEKNHMAFNVAPEIGYAINDQWQLALGVDYRFNQYKAEALGATVTNTTNLLFLQPYVRYVGGTIGHKFSLFVDLCGDIALLDAGNAYAVTLQPGIAWQATDQFTAAFRFAKIGYDHGIYGTDGFLMQGALVAPEIRIYYNF